MPESNPYASTPPATPYGTSNVTNPSSRRLRLRQIEPISAGVVMAAFYGFVGLLFGLGFLFVSLIGAMAGGDVPVAAAIGMGLGALLFAPLFYGVAGFLGGLIFAALYNLIASMVGGVAIHLET
jgi:hypothetical protein